MSDRPIIIHCLDDAKAALAVAGELDVPVTLRSAPGAARYLGAQVFRDMIEEAAGSYPHLRITSVFDCGDDPGLALGAMRHGLKVIKTSVSGEALKSLADIAKQSGARLDEGGPEGQEPALDLLDMEDTKTAVRKWLTDGK
ncbi:MAG: hypothetical protein HQ512_07565 [Rhodospirillales bacterium]|nr:hypothetical protein [Rhodospirillales bacterium]